MDLAPKRAHLRDRLLEAMTSVLDSGRFILGPEVAAFERESADYVGAATASASPTAPTRSCWRCARSASGPATASSAPPTPSSPPPRPSPRWARRRCSWTSSRATLPARPRRGRGRDHDGAPAPCRRPPVRPPGADGRAARGLRPRGMPVLEDAAQAIGARLDGRRLRLAGRRGHVLVLPDQEPRRLRRRRPGDHGRRRRSRRRCACCASTARATSRPSSRWA